MRNILHSNFESRERTSNDQRDVHPPQIKIVEFGEEDVVCASQITMGGNGSLDIGCGDGDGAFED